MALCGLLRFKFTQFHYGYFRTLPSAQHANEVSAGSRCREQTAFSTKSDPSFREPQPTKPCICGDTHWISDCHYLVPKKRPQALRSNPVKQRKVDEALQNSSTKAWVDRIFDRKKRYEEYQANQGSSSSSKPIAGAAAQALDTGAFTCVIESAAFPASNTGSLRASWILDNGSKSHVCDSLMLSRFTKTRDAGPFDTLRADTQVISIECFGTVKITIKTPTSDGYASLILLNVAYVSEFMTNLVSQSIRASKAVYFDGWKNDTAPCPNLKDKEFSVEWTLQNIGSLHQDQWPC